MATQLKDGNFTETKELNEAFDEFTQQLNAGNAKSFLVGSFDEVEEQKKELKESAKTEELEKRLKEIEDKIKQESLLIKPTQAQLKKILENKNDCPKLNTIQKAFWGD
jgi:DNA repair exonuclease SbcCD ATPase subunit